MIREISQFETACLGGGFDHLPSPPQPPSGPGDQTLVEEFIRNLKEQQQQAFFEQLATPPGH